MSTFAWYQASNAAGKIGEVNVTGASSITVSDPNVSDVSVSLPLNAVVEKASTETAVELSHYYAANDIGSHVTVNQSLTTRTANVSTNVAGLWTAIWSDSTTPVLQYLDTVNTPFKSENALYRVFSVTISAPTSGATINGVSYTQLEIAELLSTRTAKIQFASTSRAKYIPASSASTVTIQNGAQSGNDAAFTQALTGLYTAAHDETPASANSVVCYFGVYVEGVRATASDIDNADIEAGFTIAITDNAA